MPDRLRSVVFPAVLVLILTFSLAPSSGAQARAVPPVAQKPAVSAETLDKLFADATSGDWEKGQPAVEQIRKLDAGSQRQLMPRFLKLLDSDDQSFGPVMALAAIGTPALPDLIRMAQSGPGFTQRNAIWALGEIGPKAKSAIPTLLAVAKTMDAKLRGWMIGALGKIGPAAPGAPTTAQTLVLLMAAMNENVNGCESALGNYGAPAVPGLRKVLQGPGDIKIQTHAINALKTMEAPAAPAVPELMAAVKNPQLREIAILALGAIGPGAKPAIPVLKSVIRMDPEYWTAPPPARFQEDRPRQYAMGSLAKIGVEPEFLIQALKDDAPGAQDALGHAGVAAVPALCGIIRDPSTPVTLRNAVVRVFTAMGRPAAPAVPDLIFLLRDNNARIIAIYALGAIGPDAKDAVPALIAIVKYERPKDPRSKTPTTDALIDISDQFAAADALEEIGTPEALAAVKEYKAKNNLK
jgi:HEAT repeat protein